MYTYYGTYANLEEFVSFLHVGTELKSSGFVISVFTSSAILQARNIFISGVLTGKFPLCFIIFGNIVIYLPLKENVLKLGGKGKMPVKL